MHVSSLKVQKERLLIQIIRMFLFSEFKWFLTKFPVLVSVMKGIL